MPPFRLALDFLRHARIAFAAVQPLLDAVGSAVFQVGAVLLIARVAYAFARRPLPGLLAWLGLRSTTRAGLVAALALLLLEATFPLVVAYAPISDLESLLARSPHRSLAREVPSTALLLLVFAVEDLVQTSLSEEILFRGLLGKRLIAKLGFALGNSIQAVLFGALHVLAPFQKLDSPSLALIAFSFLMPALLGWCSGWINERPGGGSILPGWIAHGVGNLFTSVYLAFR